MKAPKGTRDLFGEEVKAFTQLENVARHAFALNHFEELRTPIFESADLFKRSMGETSDVVEKEMFNFTDRGDRNFSLRPEGTAGVVRHFIEQKLSVKGGIHRLFYVGPMFRAERPQAGRYRQFWQIGSEYFGSADPTADADTVLMVAKILKEFDVGEFTVQVNSLGDLESRKKYRKELLAYLKSKEKKLTEESRRRMKVNPLRVLDSKVDGPKLKEAPQIQDSLTPQSKKHFETFLSLVEGHDVKIETNPALVRGLDYYTDTVFEFVSPNLGAQNALAAGGRYDGLVSQLGGPAVPAVGFALGMDRVVSAHLDRKSRKNVNMNNFEKAVVIPMVDSAVLPAFQLAQSLKNEGVAVPPVLGPKKKFKNQLISAVDAGANWAILIGEDELKTGKYAVKNLTNREQTPVEKDKVKEFILK